MPYSWKLSTTISNNEASENYKEVNDPAVMVSFAQRSSSQKLCFPSNMLNRQSFHRMAGSVPQVLLKTIEMCSSFQVSFPLDNDVDNAELIAWTTTPW